VLLTQPPVTVHWLKVGHCRHPEWITLRGGRWRAAQFPSLTALIIHPSLGPVLYDTGYADHFHEETRVFPNKLYRWVTPVSLPAEERLDAQLSRLGVRMSDVSRVLILPAMGASLTALRGVFVLFRVVAAFWRTANREPRWVR